jgi:signal transduction histidine kinase
MENIKNKILEIVLKKKEQTRISKELHESITIALEALKYEVIEEEQLEQILKEIAETTTKTTCNIIRHPNTAVKEALNTPNIKFRAMHKTRTITCSEVSVTFKFEAIEIETPDRTHIIIMSVKGL